MTLATFWFARSVELAAPSLALPASQGRGFSQGGYARPRGA